MQWILCNPKGKIFRDLKETVLLKFYTHNFYHRVKRREDLVFASGFIGHYPQIFYVNDQRRATYMGNHEALFNLEKQGILNQSSLRKSVKGENWNDAVGGGLDSSYFSV
jgi:hypothetical protein